MKRRYAFGIAVIVLGILINAFPFAAIAQEVAKKSDAAVITVNPASRARIEIVGDTWDFGSIPKGSIVSHSFMLKNIGQDSLAITKVKPTCGCTTAPLSSNSIAPGAEANLTAIFNSEKFNGRVNKQINIDTSDPIRPYLKVSFKAVINNPLLTITPEPAEIDFGTVKPGAKAQMKLSIANGENKPVKIAIVDQANSIKGSMALPEIPAHGKSELVLDLAPQSSPGELKESITLEAVDLPDSRFTIPCKVKISE
jgi:hypothetical protein